MKVASGLVALVFLGPLAVAGWGHKAEKKQYEACVAELDGIRHRQGVHRVELERTMADLSVAFEALGHCQGDGDIGACDKQVTINGPKALSQYKESSKALEFDLNNCRNNLDNALDTLNDVPTQFTDQAHQCSEKLGRVQQELKDALQANADAQDFHGQASSCNANLDTAKKALDTCVKDLGSTKQALEDARHDRDVCRVDLKAQDDCIDFTAHISHLCPRRG